jgi:hypothetical protein
MKEIYDLRVLNEFAHLATLQNEGTSLGSGIVRKVFIANDDPRIDLIRRTSERLRREGKYLFHGWSIVRKYSKSEINGAQIFSLIPTSFFEPEGESCGTQYDESAACSKCGAGAEQISPLFLPISRIPKSKDFSQTIAGEMVVSQRFVDVLKDNQITGVRFEPVITKRKLPSKTAKWFQLHIEGTYANIVPPTLTGLALFDLDDKLQFVCPEGDLIGLNLLSELTVSLDHKKLPDIFCAHQYLGRRQGVLRPWQPIFVSPRLRDLVVFEKLKGLRFEITHVR